MTFIIIVLFIFFLYTIGGILLKYLTKKIFYSAQERKQRKKKFDGGITLEYIPDEQKSSKEFKGGDYIEYEEIK